MPTIYNFTLPRIILKQRAPKIDIVPDTICPKFNDLLLMFWQIFVCSAKSAKDNNKQTAQNYLISRKKSAMPLVCLFKSQRLHDAHFLLILQNVKSLVCTILKQHPFKKFKQFDEWAE